MQEARHARLLMPAVLYPPEDAWIAGEPGEVVLYAALLAVAAVAVAVVPALPTLDDDDA